MTSLHSPQSTTPSAQEVFTIDFGKMSPERDPRATESSYNDDFGPRTPDRSDEEQFVIHFGTREDECASRALSPETPKEDFVIDFASNLTLHSPTPSRENFDFGSHPEEDFNIDFGRNDHPGSPMEGIMVDFGPRSPSQSPLNIVIDFKNHESTTPIVESPREDFVIEFHDAPDSPRGPAAPPSPLDIMIDFKDASDSPRGPATPPSPLDIVINFKDAPDSPRGPATPPSPLDILIDFKDHSSPITPQETFLFDFTQAPDSPRGPASPTLSPYLIHFGTHTVNAPRTPPVTPSSGPGELDVDFHLPSPWRLFEPAEDVVAMSQLDYDLQLSQVAANMEASMEPAAGTQSPLHPDFLGIGPESSPSMEPANLVVRSPVIRAALRYGYKTGPEKRSLPTFIDQYVSRNEFQLCCSFLTFTTGRDSSSCHGKV